MPANNPEVTVNEEELLALLGDLETISAETSAAAPAPVVVAEAAPVEIDDSELAALAELESAPAPVSQESSASGPESEPVVAQAEAATPWSENAEPSLDDQMAELEALAAEQSKTAEPATVVAAATAPITKPVTPAPVVEPQASAPAFSGGPAATKEATSSESPLSFMIDPDQFRRDVSISDANLDSAMMEQASMRAYYGSMAAQAEAQAGRMKARFDVIEAKLYNIHRKNMEALAAAGGQKVTEKAVEAAVKTDERWLKMKNLMIDAEAIAQINKSMAISFGDRRDMLIQLGADRREEGKGQLRVLAAQQEREDLARRASAAGRAVETAQ